MALHFVRPKQRLHSNPTLIHLFSTSSSSSSSSSELPNQDGNESGENPPQPPPSSSSPSDFQYSTYFSDIKTSLKQKPQNQPQHGRKPLTRFENQNGGSFPDIRKNLNEFQRRPLESAKQSQSQPLSFHDLYKRSKAGDFSANHGTRKFEGMRLDTIKEKLRQMKPQGNATNNTGSRWLGLSNFQNTLKMNPSENVRSNVFGRAEGFPKSVFGKEMEDREKREGETEEMKSEFIKIYSTTDLGEKLRSLRPEGKKEEGWFSLQELNQRLVKLREVEEKENHAKSGQRLNFLEIKDDIYRSMFEKNKNDTSMDLNIVGIIGGTPEFLLHPPKEQLVETYFHPDNMSSAEKMKIELAKVREEFKMSESDCGSARVQVALLTTKIKHLSSVLHKKDKHSRKGLMAMVQRRKKLLKYMRRTDWDSYCFSLSKLGLRDNPDYKF